MERSPDSQVRHPSAEEIVAYARGELPEAEDQRFKDHLVHCRDCARIVLDLAGEADPADPELGAAWAEIRERIEQAPAVEPVPIRTRRAPLPRWAAAAALLAAGLISGLLLGRASWWQPGTPGTIAAQGATSLNLLPEGYLRDAGPGAVLELSRTLGPVVFRLLIVELGEIGAVTAEIRDGEGGVVTRVGDLRQDKDGLVVLIAPREVFSVGNYEISLLPSTDDLTELGRFQFTVRAGS